MLERGDNVARPATESTTAQAWMLGRPQLLAILAGAARGAIAIGSMEAFSIERAFPLFAIPFATSIGHTADRISG
jgi:hypothetical protein